MGSEEAQGLLWGAEPEGWAGHESNHAPLFTAMREATDVGSGRHVLDIGCGAGHSTALIKESGATVIGVDAAAASWTTQARHSQVSISRSAASKH